MNTNTNSNFVRLSITDTELNLLSKNFDNYVKYVRYETSDPSDNDSPISVHFYNDNLTSAIQEISNDISLKASNVIEECKIALKILHSKWTHYLINKADFILIETDNGNVKLVNSNIIDEKKVVSSNICIVVNCKKLFQKIDLEIEHHNKKFYRDAIENFAAGSMLFLMFSLSLYYFVFKK